MRFSGCLTYGTISVSGSLVQPVSPASASDAPIVFRNPRRENASSHSDAPLGNSRCIISRNSSLPASSSRLRQYSGPVVSSICSFTACRSSCLRFPGQTSGPPCCLLFSSIFLLWRKLLANSLTLPMAGVATRNVPDRANFVLLFYCVAEFDLIIVRMSVEYDIVFMQRIVRGRLIAHVEHLLARTQIFFR